MKCIVSRRSCQVRWPNIINSIGSYYFNHIIQFGWSSEHFGAFWIRCLVYNVKVYAPRLIRLPSVIETNRRRRSIRFDLCIRNNPTSVAFHHCTSICYCYFHIYLYFFLFILLIVSLFIFILIRKLRVNHLSISVIGSARLKMRSRKVNKVKIFDISSISIFFGKYRRSAKSRTASELRQKCLAERHGS